MIRLICIVLCFVPAFALPAAERTPEDSWTFTFRFENDLFGNTDRNYTNGVKFSWISPDLEWFRESDALPDWGKRAIRNLPFSREEGLQRNIAFSVGQMMFTPDDTQSQDLVPDDRPYAGWLFLSLRP